MKSKRYSPKNAGVLFLILCLVTPAGCSSLIPSEAESPAMEAYSVEDDGAGVCFCNYVYNVQPYIDIDYARRSAENL